MPLPVTPTPTLAGRRADWLHWTALGLLVAVAAAHRIWDLPWQWHVWAIDALSYYDTQARALRAGDAFGGLLSWQGLHPPGSGWWIATALACGASLPVQIALVLAASLGSIVSLAWALRRVVGVAPALIFAACAAGSALQANYASSIGPYPYLALALAAGTAVRLVAPARLGLAGLIALWAINTHVLALGAAAVLALDVLVMAARAEGMRPRRVIAATWRWWVPLAVASAFVFVGALQKRSDPWTFHITESHAGPLQDHVQLLIGRFGATPWTLAASGLLGVGAVLGLVSPTSRRGTALLLGQALAIESALAVFFALGVADPRQTHYQIAPQLLGMAAAALGWAALRGRLARGLAATLLVFTFAGHTMGVLHWQQGRRSNLHAAASFPGVAAASRALHDAGPGDVVVWLWQATFLNDEPELADPFAQHWPIHRLGRACASWTDSRLYCQEHEGSFFFFSPNLTVDDRRANEEILRMAALAARPPGEMTVVVIPHQATRPFEMESWFREAGAQVEERGGAVIFRFPPGSPLAAAPHRAPASPSR